MQLKVYEDSTNYTCQVIKLPAKIPVKGLDNLVSVTYLGNDCLVSKDSDPDELYLFFPAGCQISDEFLKANNLYRHSDRNSDTTKTGFFEDNRRVKAIKFKGVISSGFVIPAASLEELNFDPFDLPTLGSEFNELEGIEICRKYIRPKREGSNQPKQTRILDEIIDSKFAPEHFDTSHLLKNVHKLSLEDFISVTYKLHGTSARYYNTLVKRKLSLLERLCKLIGVKVQTEQFDEVCASRRCLKSISYAPLRGKQHFYGSEDLWTKVGDEVFKGKLYQGEAVYCEIIGKTYSGEPIQKGYSYGLDKPVVYIYRISNINSQGIEVDLSYHQMKQRAIQLGVNVCPELYYGTLKQFLEGHSYAWSSDSAFDGVKEELLSHLFYNKLLEQRSILDKTVVEEGFCIRKDAYPRPEIFKIKAKSFLEHESKMMDQDTPDIESEQGESVS